MKKIPIGYDSILLDYANHRKYIEWLPELHPHLCVLGNTGSGKSYFIRLLAGYIKLAYCSARAIICCYKNALLDDSFPNFYGYTAVMDGFIKFETEFLRRLSSGNGYRERREDEILILVIDEYVGWLASMEEREAKDIRKRMARLLTMSRSLSMHIVLGATRAMATDYSHGSRDCLNVIFLGQPSKESIGSFCSSEHAALMEPRGRGEGYTVFDGQEPVAITIPTLTNEQNLTSAIFDMLSWQ